MKRLITSSLVCLVSVLSLPLMAQVVAASDPDETLIFSTASAVDTSSNVSYTINDILIIGNSRTKEAIILRELPFAANQSYSLTTIVARFHDAKERLMNTGLFRNVVVSLRSLRNHDVSVLVDVEEKWYLYPMPFVKVVDGRFGQWWNERGRNLNQLNYGLRLAQYNATGRNDNLYVSLMSGYTRQAMVEYKNLVLDSELKWSTGFSIAHGKNREVNYMTYNNRLVPVRDPSAGFMRTFSFVSGDISYRPAIKTKHTFSMGYHAERMADTIAKLNTFFADTKTSLNYPVFSYSMTYNGVDFIPYPTKGFYSEASLMKYGFNRDVNMWQLSLKGNLSVPLGERDFLNFRSVGLLKLPFRQPYIRQQFVGYNDMFLQGYEDYIIDGVAGGFVKAAYHYPLLNIAIQPPRNTLTAKVRLVNPVPVKVYAKVFGNAGYIHNPNHSPSNNLNNSLLASSGVGIDIIAFADVIFKIEWSFNRLGQNGLYLHQREKF